MREENGNARCRKKLRSRKIRVTTTLLEKPSLSLAFSRYLHTYHLHSRVIKTRGMNFSSYRDAAASHCAISSLSRRMRVTIMAEREKSFEGCNGRAVFSNAVLVTRISQPEPQSEETER